MAETVEWVEDEARWAGIAGPWDALAASTGTPFATHRWYTAWRTAFAADAPLCVPVLWRDEAMVAALPAVRRGRGLEAMANTETPVLHLPVAGPAEAAALLAAALRRAPRIGLTGVGGDGGLDAVLGAASRCRALTLVRNAHVSPFVETRGDYDAWRAESKKRWGAPIERFRRKLARDHDAVEALVATPDDLEAAVEPGLRLEAAGWKGDAGTAILSRPDTARFYRAVATAFQAAGEVRVSTITASGRLVAWDLGILHQRRLWCVKLAFDEGLRRLAPGLVMRLGIVEDCFAGEVDVHELGGSNEEWKRKFATGARPQFTVAAFRRTPFPAVEYAALRGGQVSVRTLRRIRARAAARRTVASASS